MKGKWYWAFQFHLIAGSTTRMLERMEHNKSKLTTKELKFLLKVYEEANRKVDHFYFHEIYKITPEKMKAAREKALKLWNLPKDPFGPIRISKR